MIFNLIYVFSKWVTCPRTVTFLWSIFELEIVNFFMEMLLMMHYLTAEVYFYYNCSSAFLPDEAFNPAQSDVCGKIS